jgi:hypothetical protein
MPIPVLCPGCKARFSVSDKFAGKQGPCPKCKTVITIPLAAPEEVKIHVPEEFASAGKDRKGRPISKPIARKDAKLQPVFAALIAGGVLAVFALAFVVRLMPVKMPMIIVGVAAVSAPLAAAGYSFLRNDELEAYTGRELWIRASLCGLGFALLWAVYYGVASSGILSGEMYEWVVVGPAFAAIGGGIALACFDLDFGSGALLYCFYLVVTLLLRWAIGEKPLWAPTTESLQGLLSLITT